MQWLAVVGIFVEGVGLTLTAVGLWRTWRKVGEGFSLLTGERDGPNTGHASVAWRTHAHAYGRATKVGESTEDQLESLRGELDDVYKRLDQLGDKLGDEVARMARQFETERERARAEARDAARHEARLAVLGVVVLLGGLLIQLVAALCLALG
ncbi:hypothetical protein GCM10022200_05250 [Microbacterium awajiense]|uniref:Uncharacterized protein n=1 Tax=Microbacterium awajiense TaxID=415214 RepID=A0ABP7A6L5_9MICO